jgi:hypothetical protein
MSRVPTAEEVGTSTLSRINQFYDIEFILLNKTKFVTL